MSITLDRRICLDEGQHTTHTHTYLLCHIDTDHRAGLAHLLRGEEAVQASAAAQVHDHLALRNAGQCQLHVPACVYACVCGGIEAYLLEVGVLDRVAARQPHVGLLRDGRQLLLLFIYFILFYLSLVLLNKLFLGQF
jgi:hypothetical protein